MNEQDFFFYQQAYNRWRVKPDVLGSRRIRMGWENNKPAPELAMQNDEEFRMGHEGLSPDSTPYKEERIKKRVPPTRFRKHLESGEKDFDFMPECPDGTRMNPSTQSCQGHQADSWDGVVDKENESSWPDYPDYAATTGLDTRDPEDREKPIVGRERFYEKVKQEGKGLDDPRPEGRAPTEPPSSTGQSKPPEPPEPLEQHPAVPTGWESTDEHKPTIPHQALPEEPTGPPPVKPGMVRLYRGTWSGQLPHEEAFFSDESGLEGIARPFAKIPGRQLVYVDVPEEVARRGRLSGAVTEGEYQLPEEYRRQIRAMKPNYQGYPEVVPPRQAIPEEQQSEESSRQQGIASATKPQETKPQKIIGVDTTDKTDFDFEGTPEQAVDYWMRAWPDDGRKRSMLIQGTEEYIDEEGDTVSRPSGELARISYSKGKPIKDANGDTDGYKHEVEVKWADGRVEKYLVELGAPNLPKDPQTGSRIRITKLDKEEKSLSRSQKDFASEGWMPRCPDGSSMSPNTQTCSGQEGWVPFTEEERQQLTLMEPPKGPDTSQEQSPIKAKYPNSTLKVPPSRFTRFRKSLDVLGGEKPGLKEMAEAKKYDFVTLPKGVQGTNCGNCLWVREQGKGHICGNPKLPGLKVNEHNCCALWDAKGVKRAWQGQEKKEGQKGGFGTPNEWEPLKNGHLAQDTYRSIEGSDLGVNNPDAWQDKKALSSLNSLTGGVLRGYEGKVPEQKDIPSLLNKLKRAKALPPINPGHQPTLAVDFDGTIVALGPQGRHLSLEESELIPGVKEALAELKKLGFRIIIWTVQDNKSGIEAFLKEHGIDFDHFNYNPDQPTSSPKIIADRYIDDRSMQPDWPKVVRELSTELAKKSLQPLSGPASSYEELRSKAQKAIPELEQLLSSVGHPKVNLEQIPPDHLQRLLLEPGGLVIVAPLKAKERATEKVESDYGGDWSRLYDMLRATIAVDSIKELKQAISKVKENGGVYAREPKNRFKRPLANGYRDILINYRLPGGMIAEVQFHLKPILAAREKEKLAYDVIRAIKAALKEEGREFLSSGETAAVAHAHAKARQLFSDAWKDCQKSLRVLPSRFGVYSKKDGEEISETQPAKPKETAQPAQQPQSVQKPTTAPAAPTTPAISVQSSAQQQAPQTTEKPHEVVSQPKPEKPVELNVPLRQNEQSEQEEIEKAKKAVGNFIAKRYKDKFSELVENVPEVREWLNKVSQIWTEQQARQGLGGKDDPRLPTIEDAETVYNMIMAGADNPALLEKLKNAPDQKELIQQRQEQQVATLPLLVPIKDPKEFGKLLAKGRASNIKIPAKLGKDKRPYPPEAGQLVFFRNPEGEVISIGRLDQVKPEGDKWNISISPKHRSEYSQDESASYMEGWNGAGGRMVYGRPVHSKVPKDPIERQLYIAGRFDYDNYRPFGQSMPGVNQAARGYHSTNLRLGNIIGEAAKPGSDLHAKYLRATRQSAVRQAEVANTLEDKWLKVLQEQPYAGKIEAFDVVRKILSELVNRYLEEDKTKAKSLIPSSRYGFPTYHIKAGYSGIFMDKLGRRTCYSEGKKVPCKPQQQIQERDPRQDPLKYRQGGREEEGARTVKDKKRELPGVAPSPPEGYSLVFNDSGKILVRKDDRELGGFVWNFPLEGSPTESSTQTIQKATGLQAEKIASIGSPAEGDGYVVLRAEGHPQDPNTVWLAPDGVKQRLKQSPNPQWRRRGREVLHAALAKFRGEHQKSLPRITKSKFGPTFTGPIQDSRGRRVCFRDGKHTPCEEFGGQGEGWHKQRSIEDLYDAARTLVNKIKSGSISGGGELLSLLAAAPEQDLQKLKRDRKLYASPEMKEELAKLVQGKLAELGFTLENEQAEGEQQNAPAAQPAAI